MLSIVLHLVASHDSISTRLRKEVPKAWLARVHGDVAILVELLLVLEVVHHLLIVIECHLHSFHVDGLLSFGVLAALRALVTLVTGNRLISHAETRAISHCSKYSIY